MPQKHYMPTIYIHLKDTLTHVPPVPALVARGLPKTLFRPRVTYHLRPPDAISTQQLAPASISNDVP